MEFHGAKDAHGYGQLTVGGSSVGAHRLAYRLFNGPLHGDHVVRHTCDNPPCINPEHLINGSVSDNMMDSVERGRHVNAGKSRCRNDHPYDEENTYLHTDKQGKVRRHCRACNREASRKSKERKRAQR